jgi:hypothetical protein
MGGICMVAILIGCFRSAKKIKMAFWPKVLFYIKWLKLLFHQPPIINSPLQKIFFWLIISHSMLPSGPFPFTFAIFYSPINVIFCLPPNRRLPPPFTIWFRMANVGPLSFLICHFVIGGLSGTDKEDKIGPKMIVGNIPREIINNWKNGNGLATK